jgi:6-pyruvoyltetrahydropterin/6-carboxytetrahydropterin synthase
MFISTKVYDGYSTCFRQWRAADTHCKFLHGYGTSFKVWFVGELDRRNWVFDFGGMKRAINTIDGKEPKKWLDWLLDHTVIIAEDDPELDRFRKMDKDGVIQLRILPDVGAERFAEYLFNKLSEFLEEETAGRVTISKLEFREHGKNTAIYQSDEY